MHARNFQKFQMNTFSTGEDSLDLEVVRKLEIVIISTIVRVALYATRETARLTVGTCTNYPFNLMSLKQVNQSRFIYFR